MGPRSAGSFLPTHARRVGACIAASRADKVWTADDEADFLRRAPATCILPLLLALWTGQRQGDLLRLPWSAYDGTHIRLLQRKSGERRVRVVIPVGAPLKAALDAQPRDKGPFDDPRQRRGPAMDA